MIVAVLSKTETRSRLRDAEEEGVLPNGRPALNQHTAAKKAQLDVLLNGCTIF